jgi:molybdopterin molybdotransferase
MAAETPHSPSADVRMRGFARRTTVEEALAWVDALSARLGSERVSIWSAAGRVLAAEISSQVDVPLFARSMMDGFAVQAADTLGSTPYNRPELQIVGESLPGRPFAGAIQRGQAVRIMTGAPLPAGADAVLPAERVEADGARLFGLDEVPPGKNIGQVGEDIRAGDAVLPAGRTLRPQDLGVLSSMGLAEVEVVHQPRVRIVITGNELLPAGSFARESRIADANGPMLAALVERDGGVVCLGPTDWEADASRSPGEYLVPDDPAAILAAMKSKTDIIIVSGGSSVGQEDHAPLLLAQHGELAIHGIAMRPSSPTGMGLLGGKLVFLLPGNPVSCLCAYDFFAGRAIRQLGGRSPDWPYAKRRLPLARKLVSQVGRVDYARVRIVAQCRDQWSRSPPHVEPISISGASILTSTTTADGFVVIPANSEGYPAGAKVEVFLYDS